MDELKNQNQKEESVPTTDEPSIEPAAGPPVSPPMEEEKSSTGSVVGIVVIIAVLLFAGLYFWGGKLIKSDGLNQDSTAADISSSPDTTLVDLQDQSTSDVVDDIENDLGNTDLDTLLDDLDSIDGEIVQ